MGKHNELGLKGENIAVSYLKEKGLEILERNWRFRRAELDIIAMEGKTLVFVEVKTRSDDIFQRPEDAVNTSKRRQIIKAAIGYMDTIKHEWVIRFDIISVILRGGKEIQVEYIKDAFFPDLAQD
jgi:putative endonuclease